MHGVGIARMLCSGWCRVLEQQLLRRRGAGQRYCAPTSPKDWPLGGGVICCAVSGVNAGGGSCAPIAGAVSSWGDGLGGVVVEKA